MRRFFVLLVCSTCLFCCVAAAQGGFRPKVRTFAEVFADQRRTVGLWCRLDFDGNRLDKNGWAKFARLTSLATDPEFSSFYVVSRYQIMQPQSQSDVIAVTYYQMGEFRPESGFKHDSRIETLEFRTGDREGEMIIREVEPTQPRVSRQAAINWLRQQSAAAKSDTERFPFEQAIKELASPDSPAASAPTTPGAK